MTRGGDKLFVLARYDGIPRGAACVSCQDRAAGLEVVADAARCGTAWVWKPADRHWRARRVGLRGAKPSSASPTSPSWPACVAGWDSSTSPRL